MAHAKIVGIDPSLVGTALTVLDHKGMVAWAQGWTDKKTVAARHSELIFYKMPSNDPINRLVRVMDVAAWITEIIHRLLPDVLVAMEGYAFSRAGIASSDLHELGGMIKYWLVANRVPFRIYQPTTVKMAWAGSGNADKAQMQMACFQDSGIDYTQITGAGDGLADSYLLAKLLWWEIMIKSGEREFSAAPETVQKVLKRKTKAEPVELLARELLCYGGKRDYNGLSANDPV